MMYYKVLGYDMQSCHGGTGRWITGGWMPRIESLIPCRSGYHLCRRDDLLHWLGPQIWEVEADESGMMIEDDKVVVRRARLVRRLENWNARTQRLFAADCAEHVLDRFESKYPNDDIPRLMIESVAQHATDITMVDYDVSDHLVDAAVKAAADGNHAASCVAHAIRYASSNSLFYAARAAAFASLASGSAREIEAIWQTDRLFQYLNGEVG